MRGRRLKTLNGVQESRGTSSRIQTSLQLEFFQKPRTALSVVYTTMTRYVVV